MTFKVIDKKTGKEADSYKIALKEDWAKCLVYCDIEGFALTEDGVLVLMDECGNVAYCPDNRFEVIVNEEKPQGEWEFDDTDNSITCNKCGCHLWANDIFNGDANFCPNCGTDMKGGAE